jgi:hypothetical protein
VEDVDLCLGATSLSRLLKEQCFNDRMTLFFTREEPMNDFVTVKSNYRKTVTVQEV